MDTAVDKTGEASTAAAAATTTSPPSTPAGTSRTPSPVDLYKQSAARHLVAKNKARTFDAPPHHFLRSIVVLRIVVDARGVVRSVWVERGNGHVGLEQVAVKAVRDSSPLPAPSAELMKTGSLEFSETFLFRNDNRFQVRSIALEQPDPDDKRATAASRVKPTPAPTKSAKK